MSWQIENISLRWNKVCMWYKFYIAHNLYSSMPAWKAFHWEFLMSLPKILCPVCRSMTGQLPPWLQPVPLNFTYDWPLMDYSSNEAILVKLFVYILWAVVMFVSSLFLLPMHNLIIFLPFLSCDLPFFCCSPTNIVSDLCFGTCHQHLFFLIVLIMYVNYLLCVRWILNCLRFVRAIHIVLCIFLLFCECGLWDMLF